MSIDASEFTLPEPFQPYSQPSATSRIKDQLSSQVVRNKNSWSNFGVKARIIDDRKLMRIELGSEAQKEAAAVNLYMQSAFAVLVGIIPFAVAKIGEGIVKGSAFLTKSVRDFSVHLGSLGVVSEIFFRAVVGIPTTIGGVLLGGGSVLFSKSQALVWGQRLVEHPQEEKVNTKLARYGASDKPWKDFKLLLETYTIYQK